MTDWVNYPVNATVAHLIKMVNIQKQHIDIQERIIDTQRQTIGHMDTIRGYDQHTIQAMKPLLKRRYRKIFDV